MHFFFQAEDGIRDKLVTGVQTCALPIYRLATTVAALADALRAMVTPAGQLAVEVGAGGDASPPGMPPLIEPAIAARSEERRVGKECRARGSAGQYEESRRSVDPEGVAVG